MSNKTILQTNNTTISNNNVTIDNILETINNLPEAGGGISNETVSLALTITSENSTHRPKFYYASNEDGYNETLYIEVNSDSYSTTINVIKHSYVFIVPPDPFGTDVSEISSSNGIEAIYGGVMAVQVNENGTLSVLCGYQ